MLRYSLFFLISYFAFSFQAQAQLLWEISSKKLKHKSYLFGTFHVGDERVIEYAEQVYPYIDNSMTVAGELNLDLKTSFEAMIYVVAPKDSTLAKLLPKEKYDVVKSYLKDEIGELSPLVEGLRPFFIMIMLQESEQEKYTNTREKYPALDLHLQNRARANEQEVIGLETIKEQMNALSSASISQQAEDLYSYVLEKIQAKRKKIQQDSALVEIIKEVDGLELENPMEMLVVIYLSEDIELLHNKVFEEFPEESYNALIVQRNKQMVERMEKQMKKKFRSKKTNALFAAVGAAHLAGKEGMIQLLKEAGYTLTPIYFNK